MSLSKRKHYYTIVAITGDAGQEHAVGLFRSLSTACALAEDWTERDNPDCVPDGISYSAVRIQTIRAWKASA